MRAAAALLALLLAGCATAPKVDPGNPLAIAACPATLPPVTDDSFGATAAKAIEWAGIYHKCRRAALGAAP